MKKREFSTNLVLVGAALFLAAFANLAFFRNVLQTLGDPSQATWHVLSIAAMLVCTLVVFLALFSHRQVIKPVLVVLFMASALAAYFMDTYNVLIDASMLDNVAQTNSAEAGDLLTPKLLVYALLLGVVPSLAVLRARLRKRPLGRALGARFALVAGAVGLMALLAVLSSSFYASFLRDHKLLRYYANPVAPVYAVFKTAKQAVRTKKQKLVEVGLDANISGDDPARELVILVLGETARSDRFSLNGYQRHTNPMLEQRDVISFKQVQACGTSTASSVPCIFSLLGHDDFNKTKARSMENLLDVLDHAGVRVLWRDNNSSSKGVSARLGEQDFRSPKLNPMCDIECRDEGMLADLQAFIDQQKTGDVFIVLHQMGSHGPAYFKRYPPEFRIFTPTCDTGQLDDCTDEEINNSYDNTILYTDYFLSRVIDLLAANDDGYETAMVYVSDHGESLGEAGMYLHGYPYALAPEEQTRVPVIMWFGSTYHGAGIFAIHDLQDQPLTHDHIFHTVLGMFEINSGIYQPHLDMMLEASRGALQASAVLQ